jgi:hypothetical protein
MKISRVISAGLSGLLGETMVTSVGLTTKREHICPLEEYIRRLMGEISVKISRVILAGLSGLGETRLRQHG